jgi:ubiquinone/menaquinone biosynthesis C-methylase UbiE
MTRGAAARARRMWDRLAPSYDRVVQPFERSLLAGGRQWVGSRSEGRVLEVAVGTGRNFASYPPGLSVTALDASPGMLSVAARRAASEHGLQVQLCVADAQALPFRSGSFDTVVCTLSLCGVPDDAAALAEMARVVRPGGRVLLLDHVAGRWWPVRVLQRLVELVTVPAAGEHFTRRPLTLLPAVGLHVVEAHRRWWGMVERVHARR